MTPNEHEQLQCVESRLAAITAEQSRLQGERDRLLREQLDNEGAHDRRHVAAR